MDAELARIYGKLQELYSRMSYLGLDEGLAGEVEDLIIRLLERLEKHGIRLEC